jgi:hypothetical protein
MYFNNQGFNSKQKFEHMSFRRFLLEKQERLSGENFCSHGGDCVTPCSLFARQIGIKSQKTTIFKNTRIKKRYISNDRFKFFLFNKFRFYYQGHAVP